MAFWRKLYNTNENISFALGFSLNILLLIIIRKVDTQSIRKYNILLLQCCCIDCVLGVARFVVKPAIVIHQKNMYHLSSGFLHGIGGDIEMLGISLWGTSICLCVCSMPVSFIFRYRTMCLNTEISKQFYIISLITALLGASLYGLIIWKFHYIDYGHMTYLAEKGFAWIMGDDEGKVKAASVGLAVSFVIILKININSKKG